jgi:hypothetical protein
MTDSHTELIEKILLLPDRLESAVTGLDEASLDLGLSTGWTIREYVHHTVEGGLLWQMFLRAITGTSGIEIPIQWYFALSQEDWGERWAFGKRDIGPTLALGRGSIASLVELLRNLPAEKWDHYGRVTWPGNDKESCITVAEIIQMQIRHMDQHCEDIQSIRAAHHN